MTCAPPATWASGRFSPVLQRVVHAQSAPTEAHWTRQVVYSVLLKQTIRSSFCAMNRTCRGQKLRRATILIGGSSVSVVPQVRFAQVLYTNDVVSDRDTLRGRSTNLSSPLGVYSQCVPFSACIGGSGDTSCAAGCESGVSCLYPFDTGYLPLNYSGNPGVNGVYYRDVNGKRSGQIVATDAHAAQILKRPLKKTGQMQTPPAGETHG
jgi:hypothetical protein